MSVCISMTLDSLYENQESQFHQITVVDRLSASKSLVMKEKLVGFGSCYWKRRKKGKLEGEKETNCLCLVEKQYFSYIFGFKQNNLVT